MTETTTAVSLGSPGDTSIAVDGARQQVLVTEATPGDIAVFGFAGQRLATIADEPGAASVVVDGTRAFVADLSTGTIDTVDLTTLTSSGPLAQGLDGPISLALAGGYLWASQSGSDVVPTPALVRIDPTTGEKQVFTVPSGPGSPYSLYLPGGAHLISSPTDPSELFLVPLGQFPAPIDRIDVSTGVPSEVATQQGGWDGIVNDAAVTGDGGEVITGGNGAFAYDSVTLTSNGKVFYDLGSTDAVATTPADGGLVAVGGTAGPPDEVSGVNVHVYRDRDPDSLVATSSTLDAREANSFTPAPRSMAFAPDGSRLFFVRGYNGSSADFDILTLDVAPPPALPDVGLPMALLGVAAPLVVWTVRRQRSRSIAQLGRVEG